MTKTHLKMLLSMIAMLAVFAFAVACGDDDDSASKSPAPAGDKTAAPGQATQAPSGAAKPSGTITVRTIPFASWDPHFSSFNQDIEQQMMVWRGLYHLDKDSKAQPSMAVGAPTLSSDAKTITVKVKPDLKWSDGQPLDANDFVAGIQRTCNPDNAGAYQFILTALVGCDAYYDPKNVTKTPAEKDALLKAIGVRAVDATTIEFKLTDAQATFPIILALWPTYPVPKHLVKTPDAKWPGPMENVYNGPFKPSEYVEKDRLVLVPNPQYSLPEKAKVEKLVLRYIEDPAVALNAYRTGEIDATEVPVTQLDTIKKDPALSKELISYATVRTLGLQPNLKDPLLAKKEVRLALSQATDRKTLNDVILKGAHVSSTNWIPPARSGVKEGVYDAAIGFDPAKAKANLKAAGYDNGTGFPKLVLLQSDTAANRTISEFLQAEWKKHLNINIELEFTDAKTRSTRYSAKDFQLVLGGWGEDYPDPENWILGLYETGGSINRVNCSLKEIDDLIGKARYNVNNEQRLQQYRDIEKLIVENVCGMAPIYQRGFHAVVKPHIKGMIENKKPDDKQVPGDTSVELWSTTKK